MIFGKNSGVPAGLPCVRQSQDIVHYICRGDLGLVIQMAVNIRRRANIAVTQPLLNLLHRYTLFQQSLGSRLVNGNTLLPILMMPCHSLALRRNE